MFNHGMGRYSDFYFATTSIALSQNVVLVGYIIDYFNFLFYSQTLIGVLSLIFIFTKLLNLLQYIKGLMEFSDIFPGFPCSFSLFFH